MTERQFSQILYRHDPANTCCNVCEGMEDEYDRIAATLARDRASLQSYAAFRSVLVEAFFEEALAAEALLRSYEEIRALRR